MERINQHTAQIISRKKMAKVKQTVEFLTVDENFSINQMWKLKKVLCPKSRAEKTVVQLKNGDEIHGDGAVKEAYKQEFQDRLKPNDIDPLYEEYEQQTIRLLKLYTHWAREHRSDRDFTYEEVKRIIKTLCNKKAPGLDGIVNEILKAAGESMVRALVDVLNIIKREMLIPEQWNDVQITTLFKNSGSKKKLVNFRGIFLSSCISKLFEKLMMSRIRENLMKVSKSQTGATPGKCAADNTFILNACIDHAKYLNQSLTILFYDFKQCFDKLWLESILISLWDLGITNEWLALILSMNEKAKIVCKTPSGLTSPFTVERLVKQGSVMGSSLCGVQTGEYGNDVCGYQIGNYNVKPPVFVDDIAAITQGINNVTDAHGKAVIFSKRKKLQYGHSKCVYLPINSKKKDLDPFLQIDDHVMEKVSVAKYLGDQFNDKGNNKDLIDARAKRANGRTITITAMCEEGSLGKYLIITMLFLYRMMFVPTMLFNAEAWSHLTAQNIQRLRVEQLKYLKRVMAVPSSTPSCFLYLELGVLPVDKEIELRQIMFLHHILNLENDDPVRCVYVESRKFPYAKNWANNIHEVLAKYTILLDDDEIAELPRTQWKAMVQKKVIEEALLEQNKRCGDGSKTAKFYYDDLKCQDYITRLPPRVARMIFRVRSRTVKCKANQKSSHRGNMLCRLGCQEEETQLHVVNCRMIHGQFREQLSLEQLLQSTAEWEEDYVNKVTGRLIKAQETFEEL
jgi:DNA-binding protein